MRAGAALAAAFALLLSAPRPAPADLAELVAAITPSVVGVGSHQPLKNPPSLYRGTGFVIGDGNYCATNLHVIGPADDTPGLLPGLAVFVPNDGHPETRPAHIVLRDPDHDLALLRFEGAPLPALQFGDDTAARPGSAIALTGFPLGAALGLYPATHAGIVAAITPIAAQAPSTGSLSAAQIRQRRDPFPVYQLDATAFPGNSGSPVFETASGRVVAVVNMVFVRARKENAISAPSGITYAVPIAHLRALLKRAEAGETEPESGTAH